MFFLVLTIVFWDIFLNWLSYRFKMFEHLLSPAPLQLVKNGRMNRRNMRREFITEEELTGLRQQGVAQLVEVKEAFLEANGEISVVKAGSRDAPKARRKKAVSG